jgi:hypothetical protein
MLTEGIAFWWRLERYPVDLSVKLFGVIIVSHMLVPCVVYVISRLGEKIALGADVEPYCREAIIHEEVVTDGLREDFEAELMGDGRVPRFWPYLAGTAAMRCVLFHQCHVS